MRRLVVLVLLCALALGAGGCARAAAAIPLPASATPPPAATPPPEPTSAARAGVDAPRVLAGRESMTTRPFALRGGDYRLESRAATDADGGCDYSAALVGLADGDREVVGEIRLGAHGSDASGGAARGLPPGRYAVEVASSCRAWLITITPAT